MSVNRKVTVPLCSSDVGHPARKGALRGYLCQVARRRVGSRRLVLGRRPELDLHDLEHAGPARLVLEHLLERLLSLLADRPVRTRKPPGG
jgi:hypothetical protein